MKNILLAFVLGALVVGTADAQSPRKRTKAAPVPVFSAKSYLVADMYGTVYKEQDSDSVRPIASITKLMVAYLASNQDLDEVLTIPDKREFKTVIPRKVKELTRKELLTLALVRSDNLASDILCKNIPDCINQMNLQAYLFGMLDTHFSDSTGLDNGNVSTANDLLKLIIATHEHPIISELSSLPEVTIPTGKQTIRVSNTNPLTWKHHITLSKTGFTRAAGGCLVMVLDSEFGKRVLILLGSRNVRTRVPDMETLVKGL